MDIIQLTQDVFLKKNINSSRDLNLNNEVESTGNRGCTDCSRDSDDFLLRRMGDTSSAKNNQNLLNNQLINHSCSDSTAFFKLNQNEISELTYPILTAYLEWLRKINACLNSTDIIHQNDQRFQEFQFLCKHNLLFFLTVTGQFNLKKAVESSRELLMH